MWSANQTYMKKCMTKLSLTSSLVDLSRHMCLPRLHFRANLWPRLCLAGETTQCPSRTRRHRSQGKCWESSCIFLFFCFFCISIRFAFQRWNMQNFCSMLHSFIGCDAASPVAGPEPAPMDGENQLTGARGHVQQHQKKGEKITTEHT